jgi:hypothetical protein
MLSELYGALLDTCRNVIGAISFCGVQYVSAPFGSPARDPKAG